MSDAAVVRGRRRIEAEASPATTARPVDMIRVAVYGVREPELLEAWATLEELAPASPYQTRRWVIPWVEAFGRTAKVEPAIAVAYDGGGRPLALLPFGFWRPGPLTLAGFLGGKHSNFNLGLFRPGVHWTADDVSSLLARACRAMGVRVDALELRNQPYEWEAIANPIALLPKQPSPSFGYKVALLGDGDTFFERYLSRESRKKLRQKTRRLALLGPVEHVCARSPEQVRDLTEALLSQRAARDTALGLATADPAPLRSFLERAATFEPGPAVVELHALRCGGTIVATFAGAAFRGRFCGMLTAFALDPEVTRLSPGELLLASLIRRKCAEGCATFDLGVGEARYKEGYTPVPEPLFDSLIPFTLLGHAYVASERVRLRVKRWIKQSWWLWPMVQRVRRLRR